MIVLKDYNEATKQRVSSVKFEGIFSNALWMSSRVGCLLQIRALLLIVTSPINAQVIARIRGGFS